MKRRWLLIAGLAVMLFAGGLYLWRARAVQIDFAWDYDYSIDPACTPTLPTDCVEGFELSDASGVVAVIPNPTNPTGFVTGISTTIFKGPPLWPTDIQPRSRWARWGREPLGQQSRHGGSVHSSQQAAEPSTAVGGQLDDC